MAVYGSGGGTGAYDAPQPARVRLEAIGEAWSLLKLNLGTWVLTTLVYVALIYAISFAVQLVLRAIGLGIPQPQPGQAPQLGAGFAFGTLLSTLLNFVLGAFFTGGLFRMAVKQARGLPVSVGDLFSAGDVIGPLIVAALLSGIAINFGVALCVVPGLILTGLWMFTNPLIVERNMGGVDAMRLSWNTLKSDLVMSAVLVFLLFLIALGGALLCGVGLLFALPLVYLTVAVLYRDFFPATGGATLAGPSIVMPMPPSAAAPTGTTAENTGIPGTTSGAATDTPPPSTGGMAQL